MKRKRSLLSFLESPFYQAGLVFILILALTSIDHFLPHQTEVLHPQAGPWIMATALLLCFVILNTLFLFRIKEVVPYFSRSVFSYILLLLLTYGWCFLLSGVHFDEAGSFRWLWLVLTLVYMVFFAIAYTIRGIIAIADREEGRGA